MGLIKGMEQTAELIRDTTLSPTLPSPLALSLLLLCVRFMKATSSPVRGSNAAFLPLITPVDVIRGFWIFLSAADL